MLPTPEFQSRSASFTFFDTFRDASLAGSARKSILKGICKKFVLHNIDFQFPGAPVAPILHSPDPPERQPDTRVGTLRVLWSMLVGCIIL